MTKIVEQYPIIADRIEVGVRIHTYGTRAAMYELMVPDFGPGTEALLDQIRQEIVLEVDITINEILDPKVVGSIREKFRDKADFLISEKLPNIKPNIKYFLISTLLHEVVGLGRIEFLLNDAHLEEIIINSANEPIRVYHKKYGWLITNIIIPTEDQIQNYSNIIARRVGRQITSLTPLLDAHLITGDRANAVLYPISNKGNTITIRKFARDPWTITDLIANKTCSSDIFAMIWLAMEYEMNILVSGGTGAGKTSTLNVIMPFIPPNQRIISIEDTRELQLPKFLYWTPLSTRPPNTEGKGAVTMLDLLVNSLRMRPDRIILGEMRRKEEAEVLFEAMHTGHSVYATVHADTVSETIRRLTSPPIAIDPHLLQAIHLNLVMFRDRRLGIRRAYQLGEFSLVEGEKAEARGNIMYRYNPTTDRMVPHSESKRFFEEVSRNTGLSQTEITKKMAENKRIIDWIVKHNVRGVDNIGKLMNEYYLNYDNLIKYVEQNISPQKLLA